MITKQATIYTAECGCRFLTKEECEKHEESFKQSIRKMRIDVCGEVLKIIKAMERIGDLTDLIDGNHLNTFSFDDYLPIEVYPLDKDWFEKISDFRHWLECIEDMNIKSLKEENK